jgi:hypothetical protein
MGCLSDIVVVSNKRAKKAAHLIVRELAGYVAFLLPFSFCTPQRMNRYAWPDEKDDND